MSPPLCDVVVTTRNRPAVLRKMLDGLLQQTSRDFGLIVVDDASDSPMRPIVEDDRFAALRGRVITLDSQSGPAAGRNAGVAASEAEYIIFLDDDVVPCPRFVEVHLAAVTAADAVSGPPIASLGPFVQPDDWESPTPWNLWEAHQARKELRDLLDKRYPATWRQFHTGNNCLPRELFRSVGGFDARFKRSEDDELALRLHLHGCRFVFVPEAVGYHYSNRSRDAWLLTPRAYAYFDTMIDAIHPEVGHLARKKWELRRRHFLIRAVRAGLVGRRAKRAGIAAFVAAAERAHGRGMTRQASALLSIAYDLSYVQSLHDTARGRSEFGPAPRP
jgi:GT2 family glycosyltransferase